MDILIISFSGFPNHKKRERDGGGTEEREWGEKNLRGQKEKLLKTDALYTCEETGRKKIKGIKTNKQTQQQQNDCKEDSEQDSSFRDPTHTKVLRKQNSVAAGFHENESSN